MKARSLTDVMGLGAQYPGSLGQRVRASQASMKMLEKYDELSSRLDESLMSERMSIRSQIRSLQLEMREIGELRALLDIHEGITARHEEIVELCKDFEEEVIFIDMLRVDCFGDHDIAYGYNRNGVFVDLFSVRTIKFKDVEDWVRDNLEPDDAVYTELEDSKYMALNDRTAQRRLNKMTPLVEAFENLAGPGQVIVICATEALHRIPCHAPRCEGQTLIERNPIVYEILRPAVFNALSNEQATAQLVRGIAEDLGVSVQYPSTMSRADFLDALTDASFVHFHGHVRFDESNVLEHHLELSPVESQDETLSYEIPQLPTEKILTAQNVSGIKMKPGAHLTTISCKSARAKISKSNELLGLLTAFHYAGVSSAISTLWNIHRDDGARFAKAFNEAFLEDLQDESGEGGTFANMARAMQHAVLTVRRDENGSVQSPYHWAGFVFNGAWLFPRPRWVHDAKSEPGDGGSSLDDLELLSAVRRGTW